MTKDYVDVEIDLPPYLDEFIKAYQEENDIASYDEAVILLLTEGMAPLQK